MATRPGEDLDDLLMEPRRQGGRQGFPVDPGRLLLSMRRDWRWVPIAGAVWLGLGLLVALLFIGHTYKSEAILVWEPKPTGGGRVEERQLATEAGSLKLPGALRLIKQRLKLPIAIETLAKQIDVFFDVRSNLVTVDATGPTAEDATFMANTVISVFLDQQHQLAHARADEAAKAMEKDLNVAQGRLQIARNAYDAFRTEHGVSDIDKETELAIENASRLKQDQQTSNAESHSLDARIAELSDQAKKAPKTMVQSASSTNADSAKIVELQTELATAKARYTPEHPRIAALEAQIAELKAHGSKKSVVSAVTTGVSSEYQTVSTSLGASRAEREANAKKLQSIDEFVHAADERVASLSAIQGQAHSLKANIELAEKRIEDLETQLSEARDAARQPQIEWRVLTPAIEPEYPERSKRRIIVAGMPIVGMLMALLALLARPLIDGRIYTAREAGYWSQLPVIGSSAWPRNAEMFFTLVDELGDQGAAARGYTLVLGATDREKQLAEELAYWLGGGSLGSRRRGGEQVPNARVEQPMANAAAAAGGVGVSDVQVANQASTALATEFETEAMMPYQRGGGAALSLHPEGTHAWLGATEGPALRRAARMADRVIVLLTSGAEVITVVAGLRTRLGRDSGVGVVLLGLTPDLLKLPDRVGDVESFWHQTQPRPHVV
jgi:uncharacterized protein involved in exopolysaccharide biosynthesis